MRRARRPQMAAEELRFDGRVALVTGAGGGLGRAYALLLARRGAKVLVNDLGTSVKGSGGSAGPADAVVAEIRAFGGEAVANHDSVLEGDKVVGACVAAFGRVDVLVNNAGFLRDRSFAKMTEEEFNGILDVHLLATYRCCKAAWPHMVKQRYGRIVNTTSVSGLYGNYGQANYSAAKLGAVGLSFTLAKEGASKGIHCNSIAPQAASRMTQDLLPKEALEVLVPDCVAPVVAWLCHERCAATGGVFEAGGGWAAQVRWQRSPGVFASFEGLKDPAKGLDEVAARFEAVGDFDAPPGPDYPAGGQDSIVAVMRGVAERAAAAKAAKGPEASGETGLRALVGAVSEPLVFDYTARDVVLYALGVGAGATAPTDPNQLRFTYELHDKFAPLPTLPVVWPQQANDDFLLKLLPEGTNPMMILHGEHEVELHAPLPPGTTISNTTRIVDVYDKGSGALIIAESVATDAVTGAKLATNRMGAFARGLGGFGGPRGPAGGAPPAKPPRREPDAVVEEKTSAAQALVYRLSGDYNPLHADPQLASAGGFQVPILHGLCTFGFGARAVLSKLLGSDPSRVRSVAGRFSSPVYPGETLVTSMWQDGPERVLFQVAVKERSVNALVAGVVGVRPPAKL